MKIKRHSLAANLISVGVATVVAASMSACSSNPGQPQETQEKQGKNICEFWSGDEYDDAIRDIRATDASVSGSLSSSIVDAASQLRRCGGGLEFNTITLPRTLRTISNIEQEEGSPERNAKLLPAFYETYLTEKGLLAGWSAARLIEPQSTSESELRDKQEETQRILSMSFAKATDTSREEHTSDEFVSRLQELAKQRIKVTTYSDVGSTGSKDKWKITEDGPTVYGWSVLAPLLRHGDFHQDFLAPVATAIIKFDQKHNGNWTVKGQKPMSFDMVDLDAKSGIESVLKALSRDRSTAKKVAEATGDKRVEDLVSAD